MKRLPLVVAVCLTGCADTQYPVGVAGPAYSGDSDVADAIRDQTSQAKFQELQREGAANVQRTMDRMDADQREYQSEQNENTQRILDRSSELYGNGAY